MSASSSRSDVISNRAAGASLKSKVGPIFRGAIVNGIHYQDDLVVTFQRYCKATENIRAFTNGLDHEPILILRLSRFPSTHLPKTPLCHIGSELRLECLRGLHPSVMA